MSTFRKAYIPLIGAVLVLVGFFLPWIAVDALPDLGLNFTPSGFGLANLGRSAELSAFVPESSILLVLWVFLIIGLAVLGLGLWLLLRAPLKERSGALWQTILGAVGMALIIGPLLYVWLAEPEITFALDSVTDPGMGLWLTVLGLLIIIVGGVVAYQASHHAAEAYQGPSTIGAMTQMTSSGSSPVIGGAGGAAPYTPAGPSTMDYSASITAYDAPPARRATEVLNRAPAEGMAWLVVKDGPRTGHTFRLQEQTNIGGDAGNDVILDDSALSGQHARVKFEEGHFVLYDLASTNGVYIYDTATQDWQRIYRYDLVDGQQVRLGRTVLHFMAPAETK